jgi:hypothetical protein
MGAKRNMSLEELIVNSVNGDCARFLAKIRDEAGEYSKRIFIGGIMGCKGDAYKPQEALGLAKAMAKTKKPYILRALI